MFLHLILINSCIKALYPSSLSLPLSWQDLIGMGCRSWKWKTMVAVMSRLVFSSIVYDLWGIKDELKHKVQPKTEK
jgi:hypothetical protein